MRFGILPFAAAAMIAAPLPVLAAETGHVVEDHSYGCVDKDDLASIRTLSSERNVDAVMRMVADKKCFVLEMGEKVTVDSGSSANGLVKIRTERSPVQIWVNEPVISMK